jgi:enoyl-CoA hydratase/carnithine racemase
MELVRYERIDNYGLITIDRPEKRNSLSIQVIAELRRAVAMATEDRAVRSLVITGAGGEAFSAGGDLVEMGAPDDPIAEHRGRGALGELFLDMWSAGKPTVGRVDGYCLAGGFGIAMACDYVVASRKSRFGTPEVRVGLWPYMITVPMLRSMAPKLALRLMMTGETIDAAEAERLGFVEMVEDSIALDRRVAELTDQFAASSPQAIALGRTAFYSVVNREAAGALANLQVGLSLALGMSDAREGLQAFKGKRRPHWT